MLSVVAQTLAECAARLPRPGPLTTVLLPLDQGTPFSDFVRAQMNGVAGLTPGANLLLLQLDADAPPDPAALRDTLAREYHHAAWIALRPDVNRTRDLSLADALAFEGRACCFARQLTGGWLAPWTRPLPESDFTRRVRTALEGDQDASILSGPDAPPWAVYRLNTAWVEAALARRPQLGVTGWTVMDGLELLSPPRSIRTILPA